MGQCYVSDMFVLHASGSKFNYEWVLLSMPDGKEIGNMVGKNTDTLQLSKVSYNEHF